MSNFIKIFKIYYCFINVSFSLFRFQVVGILDVDNDAFFPRQLDNYINIDVRAKHLKKTIFSNSTRLVFVAGLYGSGHHVMSKLFHECNGQSENSLCYIDKRMNNNLYNPDKKEGLFDIEDIARTQFHVQILKRHLSNLDSTTNRIILTGLRDPLLSYPITFGHFPSLPDIYMLANLCELAGIDFRVVVLMRSAQAIVNFTRFDNTALPYQLHHSKILVDAASALYSQLKLISRSFFICHHADAKIDPSSKFLRFIHPLMHTAVDVSVLGEGSLNELPQHDHSSFESKYFAWYHKIHTGHSKSSDTTTEQYEEVIAYYRAHLYTRLGLIHHICHGSET